MGPSRFDRCVRGMRATSPDWSDPAKTTETINGNEDTVWSEGAVAEFEAALPLAVGA